MQVHPFSEALASGELLMPEPVEECIRAGVAVWHASTINCTLVVIATLLGIILLDRFLEIFPFLIGGFFRKNSIIKLEDSVRHSRDRGYIAMAAIIPFCLILSRYELFLPDIIAGLTAGMRTLCLFGMFAVYMAVRQLFAVILRPSGGSENYWLSFRSGSNFFVLLVLAMAATVGIGVLTGMTDALVSIVLYAEMGLVAFIFIVRRIEILSLSFNLLPTILYLCTLEILPVGIVVVPSLLI